VASRDRERRLARAKLERQKARRAARERARRQTTARVFAGLATIAVLAGVFFVAGGPGWFKSKKHEAAAGTTTCLWAPNPNASGASSPADAGGTPPTTQIPTIGTDTMTMTTDQGTVSATLNRADASCTVASMKYLADRKYFDGSHCWRLQNADKQYFLQCGDKVGDGTGNPGYTFADENPPYEFAVPSGAPSPSASDDSGTPTEVIYPAGTLAMANTNNTNGSQFLIVFKDSTLPPAYTVFGTVTSGLDVITKIADAGVTAPSGADKITKPKQAVTASSLTVTEDKPSSTPGPSENPSPSVEPSTAPAASPSSSKS
jgi:peptidyl-prolyl cis-trans isomerase B (cyclophilin B)